MTASPRPDLNSTFYHSAELYNLVYVVLHVCVCVCDSEAQHKKYLGTIIRSASRSENRGLGGKHYIHKLIWTICPLQLSFLTLSHTTPSHPPLSLPFPSSRPF